jgi:arylsulfatase A-like enzyme
MSTDKPNILLLVVDCLRADRTFGPDRTAQTPNLHALAEGGALFDTLITANSMTIPCMTTMFSGMYPQRHGVRAMVGSRVSDDIPLLAELLQQNGYHTYAEASGPLSSFYRLDRGFDRYQVRDGVKESLLGAWGDDLIGRFQAGAFEPPWFVYVHLWGVHRPRQVLPEMNTPEFGKTQYDRAISSYDRRLGDLFAVVDQTETITLVTGDHGEKIPENELETQVEFLKKSLTGTSKRPNSAWTRVRRKGIAQAREAWVSGARLLHRAGLVDSPLVSVTGHGYHVYDSLVRVPLVVSGGGVPAGQTISEQVRQVDIMPTVLELAGVTDALSHIDGRSLVPALDGEVMTPLPAFIETCQNSREPSSFYGVRDRGWKYAFDAEKPQVPEELYDLAANPAEDRNLIKQNPAKAAELRGLILVHLEQEQRAGSTLADELSDDEMAGLAEHLKKLGYVE